MIDNITAPDQFGAGGTGTAPDFKSDDFYRLIGFRTADGVTQYCFSQPFRITQGQAITISADDITFTNIPPPLPASLSVSSGFGGSTVLQSVGDTVQLIVTAALVGGGVQDVTPSIAWTTYRSSNTSVVSVTANGLVTAIGPGLAYVTANNEGAIAVKAITVVPGDPLTDVHGFAFLDDGSPAVGANVSVYPAGVTTTTDSSGKFIAPGVPTTLGDLNIIVQASSGSSIKTGSAVGIPPIPGGMTDAGIITLTDAVFWAVDASGNWSDGNNWSTGSVPQAGDDVIINRPTGQYEITFDGISAGIGNLICAEDLTIAGGDLTITGVVSVTGTFDHQQGIVSGGVLDLGGPLLLGSGTLRDFTIQGGGGITVSSSFPLPVLDGISLSTPVTLLDRARLAVTNGLNLDSSISLESTQTSVSEGNLTRLDFFGTQSLLGSGQVVFAGTSSLNRIRPVAGTLTIGNGITIRGMGGQVGEPGRMLINGGTIRAETGGNTIVVTGQDWRNPGVLASSGGSICIEGVLNNLSDTLTVNAGTGVLQLRGTISGGQVVSTDGTGLEVPASGVAGLSGVNLSADLQVGDRGQLIVTNGLVLNGSLKLNATNNNGAIEGNLTRLDFDGSQVLSGAGDIEFVGSSPNHRLRPKNGSLTIGSGLLIHGKNGEIGSLGQTFVNQGTIDADDAAGGLILVGDGWSSPGNLEATAADITLTGRAVGTIDGSGTGQGFVTASAALLTLDGVTLNRSFRIPDRSQVLVSNGLTLNATISLEGSNQNGVTETNLTRLDFLGPQLLTGTGEIVFSGGSDYNRVRPTNGVLTIENGITLRGRAGEIGRAGESLVNQGTIRAEIAGQTIAITGDPWSSPGPLQSSGGTVCIKGTLDNQNGLLTVNAGTGTLNLAGTIHGGQVTSTDGTGMEVSPSTQAGLSAVLFNANLVIHDRSQLLVTNGLTLNGSLRLKATNFNGVVESNLTRLDFVGTQNLSGSGDIEFIGNSSYHRLRPTNGTLTIGGGILIHGNQGEIGSVGQSFVNQGTIEADVVAGGLVLVGDGWSCPGSLEATAADVTLTGRATGAIGGSGAGLGFVTASATPLTLDNVTLNTNLRLPDRSQVLVTNGLTANATILLEASNQNGITETNLTRFDFVGSQILSGTGEIVFAGSSDYNRVRPTSGLVTIDGGVTLRGRAGEIGRVGQSLVNQGTIRAEVSGQTIAITGDPWSSPGTLQSAGGTICIKGTLDNQNGLLTVDAGTGVLKLAGTILGGQVTSTDGTEMEVSPSTLASLNSVLLDVDLVVQDRSQLVVTNGLILNGSIRLNATNQNGDFESNLTRLDFDGSQVLGGTGDIEFVGSSPYHRLRPTNGSLTIGGDILIHGRSGEIGRSGQSFINLGTIDADNSAAGLVLVGDGWSSPGALEASAADLRLTGRATGSIGGSGIGLGFVTADVSPLTLDGVTLNTNLRIPDRRQVLVTNGLTTNAAIRLEAANQSGTSESNLTRLDFMGSQILSGVGEIVLSGSTDYNRVRPTNGQLTIDNGITLRGRAGEIGRAGESLANQGTIRAEIAGQTIAITGDPWSSPGPLQSTGGTICIKGTFDNQGQALVISSSTGTVALAGTIKNGQVTTPDNTGIVVPAGAVAGLDDVTIDCDVLVGDRAIVTVMNGLTLNSNLTLDSLNGGSSAESNLTRLDFSGMQSLSGSGTVLFGGTSFNHRLRPTAGALTIGPGITIRGGSGEVGRDGEVLVNQGLIQADTANRTIIVKGSGWSSSGSLEANGGVLQLAGTIANTGQDLKLSGGPELAGKVTGGSISSSSSPGLVIASIGSQEVDGVTLNCDVLVKDRTILLVTNGLTLNSNLTLDSLNGGSSAESNLTRLDFSGMQTLSGSGTVLFGGTSFNHRLRPTAGALTIGPGITIRGGSGEVGRDGEVLVNQGLIQADTANRTIIVKGSGWSSSGSLEANGGALQLAGIVANTGQVLSLVGGPELVGKIVGGSVNGSAGATLVSNTYGELEAVTLNCDMVMKDRSQVVVTNGLTVNGNLTLNSLQTNGGETNLTRLDFLGAQTIQGSGLVRFAGTGTSHRIRPIVGALTIGAGLTVAGGGGEVGSISRMLINNGTIRSEQLGKTLLVAGTAWQNNGSLETSNGGLMVASGTWTTAGTITIDSGTTFTASVGIVQTAGEILVDGLLGVSTSINLMGGFLTGNGIINGDLVNAAEVRPGSVIGVLTINGNYSQGSSGILSMAIGGTTAGTDHDQLAVSGMTSLDGTLALTLDGGFLPAVGQSFRVMTYGSSTGVFNLTGDLVPGGLSFVPTYGSTALDLTVVAAP